VKVAAISGPIPVWFRSACLRGTVVTEAPHRYRRCRRRDAQRGASASARL